MASPSELSLECKPHLNTYSMLLKSFGDHHQAADKTQRLEEVLACLEEERLKIEVFKRELPLCMQLLTNAVEASRQQLQASRSANQGPRPVLEEFIPLKNSAPHEASDKCSNTCCDKANWMTSAQLWSQPAAADHNHATKPESTITSSTPTSCKENDASIGFNVLSPNLALDTKTRNGGGGAFLPFSKEQQRNATLRSLSDLALASADKETDHQVKANKICTTSTENENNINNGIRESSSAAKFANNEQGKESSITTTTQTTHRKARRCWSPDLHRRFVNALQMLGGSQVATPKQIRELMKVDGLTNDEVKSHLQKYRLHTRRPSPSPQAAGAPAPQLVVLGGIWVPPEYATAAAHSGAPSLYGASPASHPPPHFCAPVPPVPQDFYTAATPTTAPHLLHHHQQHQHQLYMYKATSQTTQSSPESDARGAGERSESIEDGKSESSSWKGESGENGGGERRGLAALRVDGGGDSNASEITLKF
ncbi:hypothetical protein HS088_TW04G01644 [Tripterygium wilfordii]|uniref:HTH myb-type domain-containing protein n=1 Tax=Tripterygium wilfordii TaxID=458696 RepID=A0A7J7DTP1_TRIWF|nr:myb family transcription factor EFM [Tripterygium wilfordii]KAF5749671.1 hypothetical protein HS088_TW04G01644 [Tripterygium wilfordii]